MDLSSYVSGVRQYTAALARRNAEAQAQARSVLPRLAQAIGADARVRRAYLFGSLAKNKFHPGSDIDIAVEGLNLFERDELRQNLETLTEFPVDVRDLNSTPQFRELVEFYGELLYAQS
ncbi:MAG: nucleotidyltransferase domain-containing protein [Phycisphaerae bacterium]|nr:nucleotidyltransferase domain-containing protein [Phycisphaerae bacterium]